MPPKRLYRRSPGRCSPHATEAAMPNFVIDALMLATINAMRNARWAALNADSRSRPAHSDPRV